jgi:hypothetical protein
MVSPRPALIVTQPLPKPWWRSKTVIVNLVVLMLAGAESQLNVLQGVLPGNVYTWLAFALPIVNLALRAVTTQGVSLSDPAAPVSTEPVLYRQGFEPTEPLPPRTDSEGGHVD